MNTFKIALKISFLLLAILIFWLVYIYSQMQDQFEQKSVLPSIEMYTKSFVIKKDYIWVNFSKQIRSRGYKKTREISFLSPQKSFSLMTRNTCSQKPGFVPETQICFEIHHKKRDSHFIFLGKNTKENKFRKGHRSILNISSYEEDDILEIEMPPLKFAQLYQGQSIKKTPVHLGEIPLYCLQGVTAIEDNRFLSHYGISLKGILRAALKNLTNMRLAEGGSTITQQLVKNFFLVPDKTFKRKFKEIFMSMILELQLEKDLILEKYLNVIYMGQSETFQIRGYGEAAQHYFSKNISKLRLSECALLAGIIRSPGRFNPFSHSERAEKRRNLVLKKMRDFKMISQREYQQAIIQALPQKSKISLDPSPYFAQLIYKELEKMNIGHRGLKVYTSLDPIAQSYAKKALQNTLDSLEKKYLSLKEKREAGKRLQASLISVDLQTGAVLSAIGGRRFKQTQYNRIHQSHRQVGSIMKPLVYLTALESKDENNVPYSPLSVIEDEEFTYKYDKQTWTPKNYKKDFSGRMPLFYALKNSINVPTAKLSLQVGLKNIVKLSKKLGVISKIKAVPSLSLGSFELYIWEVAQVYSNIARFGIKKEIHFIKEITDPKDNKIYEFKDESESEALVNPKSAALLVSMMRQTTLSGTARSLSSKFDHFIASKTGTTSNYRDAWFAGFTPDILTIVWVGYDNNISHGLSGATGALPIWSAFMQNYLKLYPVKDFDWSSVSGIHKIKLSVEDLKKRLPDLSEEDIKKLKPVELFVRD